MLGKNLNKGELILIAIGIVIVIVILGVFTVYYNRAQVETYPKAYNNFTDTYQSITAMDDVIENFAVSDADFKKFLTDATATDGLTFDQRKEILYKLGCQSAINQNMEGYRSLESGATFKIEKVSKIGESDKYMIHAADNLVLSVDPASGQLSRAIKDTNDQKQLFTRETVKDAAGANTNTVIFIKELASKAKLALQYEHESISLRPLDTAGKPWRGQQFTLDVNLTGQLLDNSAMVLGYRLAPNIGGTELQNAGGIAVAGSGTTATIPLATTGSSLSELTQNQINSIAAAVSANINAFNQSSGGAQPGTLNNPFANNPIRVNLNLGGLGSQTSVSSSGALSGMVPSGFTDIPRNHSQLEGFATVAGNQFQTGQIRDLIAAWDAKQPGANQGSGLGGLSTSNKSVSNALRGKMVSCPKIDRSQYYTERQLAQCAGCTPDTYLRGQLGNA
jgi:hypothetical protein